MTSAVPKRSLEGSVSKHRCPSALLSEAVGQLGKKEDVQKIGYTQLGPQLGHVNMKCRMLFEALRLGAAECGDSEGAPRAPKKLQRS